ncbi:MAG: hypothetical protein FWD61_18375 [Phycisphaerales bacterium]|nr:hypothetical protein [Phycisphaerales bacterium]
MSTKLSSRDVSFSPTQWTVILAAVNAEGVETESRARAALEKLAKTYWYPLYAFIRRRGIPATEAEDLTQAFFARLLEKGTLTTVDREKGKFRSFLLASVTNFLANESDKAQTLKRGGGGVWGGGRRMISLDAGDAEVRYRRELADDMTPERVFEQRWAWTVLDHVMARLREAYQAKGQGELFESLKGVLTEGRGREVSYAKLGADLNMAEGTVAVAAHRLRRAYRKLLRNQIAQTVADPALIDEEIRYLLNCL